MCCITHHRSRSKLLEWFSHRILLSQRWHLTTTELKAADDSDRCRCSPPVSLQHSLSRVKNIILIIGDKSECSKYFSIGENECLRGKNSDHWAALLLARIYNQATEPGAGRLSVDKELDTGLSVGKHSSVIVPSQQYLEWSRVITKWVSSLVARQAPGGCWGPCQTGAWCWEALCPPSGCQVRGQLRLPGNCDIFTFQPPALMTLKPLWTRSWVWASFPDHRKEVKEEITNNCPHTDIFILLGGLQGVPEVDVEIRNRLEVPSSGFTSSSSSLEVR